MNDVVDVELRLHLNDGGAPALAAASKRAQKAAEDGARAAGAAVEGSVARQRASYQRLSHAREALGIRSEQAIQREIVRTEAAYQRLMRSGTMSLQAQARAADAMHAKVRALSNEMGRLTAAQKALAGLRFGASAVAGLGAAAYTLKAPVERALSYDLRLAHMANTAFAERDATGRKMGLRQIEQAIESAREKGGGTRESAADALDTMVASGVVPVGDAIQMLPGIVRAATASNTSANDLATIAIRAQQTFKINPQDIDKVLSAALAAGQAGGFELADMAKWLPQQMAMAGNLGISGKEGFARLTAWNQASRITAGSADQAGNNMQDLLNELNSPHFKQFLAQQYFNDGRRLKPGERLTQGQMVDRMFLDYQSRGINKVDAAVDIMGKLFAKDKNYQALQARLAGMTDKDDRRAILESMRQQMEGSAVGKVFHNQQSMLGMLGLLNNQGYMREVLGKALSEYAAPPERSATGVAWEVISGTASFAGQQAVENAKMAQKKAVDELSPAIKKASDMFSDLAGKYPALTGSATLATSALGALAGAAGLTAMMLGGRVPGGAAISGAAASAAPAIGTAAAGIFAGYEAYRLGSALSDWWGASHRQGVALSADAQRRIDMGALADQSLREPFKPAEQKPIDIDAALMIGLAPGLTVQSQSLQATGANVRMDTGNIMTGAPG